MSKTTPYFPTIEAVKVAARNLEGVSNVTPLIHNLQYSSKFDCNLSFKREDLQVVRSYKIRGAYNKMKSLTTAEKADGIVCASAGNHAQGVALSCKLLKIKGTIFMPIPTPNQKIERVKMFGEHYVKIVLLGDSFDDAYSAALEDCNKRKKTFIHPFNDEKVIEGQATLGLELINQAPHPIDYIFVAVGGGGLASGMSTVFKALSPNTKIIGVEPQGAPSMKAAFKKGEVIQLETIDNFVDGAAVKRVGDKNFQICRKNLYDMITVSEGSACQTILDLYNKDAIIAEPAGALSVAALDSFRADIKGKNVVCIISGGNNDITRTAEIKERALIHSKLKHYFIITFPQRAGALREFVVDILGPNDDITHFEYTKKVSRETGVAVVGIELKSHNDLKPLISNMRLHNFYGDYLNDKPDLLQFLV
jgi:threonine dehydratase